MTWLVLKALHVAVVLAWVGGLLMLALLLGALASAPALRLPQERRLVIVVRAWDRCVTAPAMLAAWALGIAMASHAGWFGAPWLWGKLAFALGLSGLHGVLSGTLRRLTGDNGRAVPAVLRFAAPATVAAAAVIAALVVLKPG